MTVLTELAGNDFPWTGVETIFAPGFAALSPSNLQVQHISPAGVKTLLTFGVHYTASVAPVSGLVSVFPLALPGPGTLRIDRYTPAVHSNQFLDGVRYPQAVHERLADAAAMRDAELRRDTNRLIIASDNQANTLAVQGTLLAAHTSQIAAHDTQLGRIEGRIGTVGGPQVHLYNAVLDGGVDNSGLTNARAKLEAAIDLAANAGKTLWIPNGTYDLGADTLTIARPDAKVWCQSQNVVIRRSVTGSAPLVQIDADNVTWSGGRLVYVPSTFAVTGSNVAILNNRRKGVTIEHTKIEGRFYVGVHHESAINPLTFGVTVRGAVNRSFYSSFLVTPAERANHRYLDCIADGRELGGSASYTNYGFNLNAYGLGVATGANFVGCIAQHCTSQGFGCSERVNDTRLVGCQAWYITAGVGFLFQKANGYSNDRSGAFGCSAMFCEQGFYVMDSLFILLEGVHAGLSSLNGITLAGATACRVTGICEYSGAAGLSLQAGTVPSTKNRIDIASHVNTGWGISESPVCDRNNYAGSTVRDNVAGNYQILGTNPGTVGTL